MKTRLMAAVLLAIAASLMCTTAASAKNPKDKIAAIVADGQDGTVDGHYSTAEIQAALKYIKNDPLQNQYGDLPGILEIYLASLKAPDVSSGVVTKQGKATWELAFTGSRILFVFGAGLALIGSGLALRRRRA
jgi:hypothetical protein